MVAQTRPTVGGLASGTSNATPALPSGWAPDDILVLPVETSNEAVAAPTGWFEASNSPVAQTNADVTRLTMLWRRAQTGDGNPTLTDPGDHVAGRMIAVKDVVTTGDPWEATAGAADNTSSTTAAIPTGTTSEVNGLVVVAVATGIGGAANSTHYTAWTNASLLQGPSGPAGMVERFDSRYTAGNGGSIGLATAQKLAAGAVGTTTATLAVADVKACWSGVLKSAAQPIEFVTSGSSTTDGTSWNTVDVAPRANAYLLLGVVVSGTSVSTPTITGFGLTWALEKVVTVGGTGTKLAVYKAKCGATPSTGQITITIGATGTGASWSLYMTNGENATTPIVQSPTAAGFAANVAVTFSAAADAANRQVVWVAVAAQNTQNSITPPANWVEDAEVVRSTPSAKIWSGRRMTGFDTTVTVADDSSYDYGAIGLEVNFVTAAAVGKDQASAWNVKAAVGDDQQSAWHVRAAVGDPQDSAWNVCVAVGRNQQTTWQTAAVAGSTVQAAWHTRQAVDDSETAAWHVLTTVGADDSAAWNVRTMVGVDQPAGWHVRAATGAQASAAWNVTGPVGVTASAAWSVAALAATVGEAAWFTAARIGVQADAAWKVAAAVGVYGTSSWRVAANVAVDKASAWNVRVPVAASQSTSWNVAKLVGVDGEARWDTDSTSPVVGVDGATGWNVRAAAGASWSAGWATRTAVAAETQTEWIVRARVGATRDATWRTRVVTGRSTSAGWVVLRAVGVSCTSEWTAAAVGGAEQEPSDLEGGPPRTRYTGGAPYIRFKGSPPRLAGAVFSGYGRGPYGRGPYGR